MKAASERPNPALSVYLEEEILPRYDRFDAAHRRDHAEAVTRESLRLAARYGLRSDMVRTIAVYHDLGLEEGRERHHLRSGELLRGDLRLRRWFSEGEIALMADAAEDHRASSEHAPRTIYGRIVAEADRTIDPETILRRTVQYGLSHLPTLDREAQYARFAEHLQRKYAEGGYLRLWIPDAEKERRLERLRALLRDEAALRRAFNALYDNEKGGR